MLTMVEAHSAPRDGANCTRTRLCNGIMCENVCAPGTVQVDPWVDASLRFQRILQRDLPLVRSTMIGTHNSAIAQAYGYGIEQGYIEGLLNVTLFQGDDLGEGVSQFLSVTDQLNLGLRHIEIDITSGYFEPVEKHPEWPHLDDIFVCHSPVPLDPETILKVEAAARKRHIDLGWDARNLSCAGTNVPYRAMLDEVAAWMAKPEHADEVVVLYLDTKPLTVQFASQTKAAHASMRAAFDGITALWTPADGDPLQQTPAALVAAGKRVVFEDHDDGWKKDGPPLVFTPDLFHQIGAPDVGDDCAVGGTPVGEWRGRVWQRALEPPPGFGRRAAACALGLTAPNYLRPQDVADYVWSWAAGEPRAGGGDCVVARAADGRWAAHPCDDVSPPLACRNATDDAAFVVVDGAACPDGFVARPPTDGYANQRLRDAAGGRDVRVNVSTKFI